MIRKEGKARWTYTCDPCSVRATFPDQFRAIERQQKHERGFGHFGTWFGAAVSTAFSPIISAFGLGTKLAAERERAMSYERAIAHEIWRAGQ